MNKFALLASMLFVPSGCVYIYAPGVAPVGRMLPPTVPYRGDVLLEVDLAHNVADGVDVPHDGALTRIEPDLPVWPGASVAMRQTLTDGFGLEARLTASLIVPIPGPIPNGFSLAPVLRLKELTPKLGLYVSPRVVRVSGRGFAALTTAYSTEVKAWGLELPVMLAWQPRPRLATNVTSYLRTYRMTGQSDYSPDGEDWIAGVPARWTSTWAGTSLNVLLTLRRFQAGLGVGMDLGPPAGLGLEPCLDCDATWTLTPQVGLSIGGAWGEPKPPWKRRRGGAEPESGDEPGHDSEEAPL